MAVKTEETKRSEQIRDQNIINFYQELQQNSKAQKLIAETLKEKAGENIDFSQFNEEIAKVLKASYEGRIKNMEELTQIINDNKEKIIFLARSNSLEKCEELIKELTSKNIIE